MKKIVVVVRGKRLIFTGENLWVDDIGKNTGMAGKILVVKNRTERTKAGLTVLTENTLAVFKHWDFWYEDNDQCTVPRSKVLIRLKKPYGAKAFRKLWANIADNIVHSDIIPIPDFFEIIVLDPDCKVEAV